MLEIKFDLQDETQREMVYNAIRAVGGLAPVKFGEEKSTKTVKKPAAKKTADKVVEKPAAKKTEEKVTETKTEVIDPMAAFMGGATTEVTPPADDCPVKNQPDLLKYVMDTYKQLGAEKGQNIQAIFGKYGHKQLSDIPDAQIPTIYKEIEALKG